MPHMCVTASDARLGATTWNPLQAIHNVRKNVVNSDTMPLDTGVERSEEIEVIF
jgi:hypothetical protein